MKTHAQAVDEDGYVAGMRIMGHVMQRDPRNRDPEEMLCEACQRVKPLLL
ncbi:hypothetical protein AB4061_03150 [Cupriavidus sp. YAF13]